MEGVRTTDEGRHRPPDTRSIARKATDWLVHPHNAATAVVVSSLAAIPQPALAWLTPIVILVVLLAHLPRIEPRRLVMRMPAVEGKTDLGDPKPGRRSYNKARGVMLIGNDLERGNCQLWMSADDACTHMLMLGTTGAGKTFNFIALACNALAMGSGVAFSDAKGDSKLAWEFRAMAERFGREDDFLMVSMLTVGRDPTTRTSNRMNPFSKMNADGIVQLLSALAPEAEGSNAIFVKMGITLLRGVVNILVYLRDHHGEPLSVGRIRSSISLGFIDEAWVDTRLPPHILNTIKAFGKDINFVPKADRGEKPHGQSTLEQFQYAAMNFTDALASLADTYGHVYRSSLADIDTDDVVRRRRLLVIMLPALEKSREELKTTGRLILASLRDAASKGIGSGVEGTRAEILEAGGGAAPPFMLISDEHGQIAVPGIGTIMAQARSLRVMVVIGSQDWTKIEQADKGEAAELWSNARFKAAGSLEDGEGYDKFAKQAGQTAVTEAPGLEMPAGSWFGGYRRDKSVGVTLRDRINFTDVQGQIEGETTIVFRGQLIRGQMFNPDIQGKITILTVGRFLAVGEAPRAPEVGGMEYASAITEPSPGPGRAPQHAHGTLGAALPAMPATVSARGFGAPVTMPSITGGSEDAEGAVVRGANGEIEGLRPAAVSTFDLQRGDATDLDEDPFAGYDGSDEDSVPLEALQAFEFAGMDPSGLDDTHDEEAEAMAISVQAQIESDGGVTNASLLVALQTAPMPSAAPDAAAVLTHITEAVETLVHTATHH